MTKLRFLLLSFVLCTFGCLTMVIGNVSAAGKISLSGDQTLFAHQNIVIPSNETIDHIVEIGGNVTLAGSVHEIIVVGGNLHIAKTAHVRDLVLVIGGTITQDKGAKVTDELFQIASTHELINNLLVTGSFLFGLWFLRLSFSLLIFLLPIVTVFLLKHQLEPFETKIRQEFVRTLLIGIATSLLFFAIVFLLLLSLIGIPLLVLMVLLLIIFGIINITVISLMIGRQIKLTANKEKWLIIAVGSAILTSCINFPLLGWVLLLFIHWLSFGLMTIWFLEMRTKFKKTKK